MEIQNKARFFLLIIALLLCLSVISLIYKQYFISILLVLILIAVIINAGKKSATSYFEKSILNFLNSRKGHVSKSQMIDYFKERSSKIDSQKIEDTITEALKKLQEKGLVKIELQKDGCEVVVGVGIHSLS